MSKSLLKDAFKQGNRRQENVAVYATLRYTLGMAKTHPISIRFDPELRAELEKIAQRENRKLSNLVETILRQYVEAQKRKAKRDE
jgi:molybdopterin-guanine dinucleotide biosynthesis protein A